MNVVNNNKAIVRLLIKRSMLSNRNRNLFITLAIMLTSILLASVFSIGAGILDSFKMQQIRLMGTTAHAALSKPTEDEVLRLKSLDYVKVVGMGNHVASVSNTPEMGEMILSLYCFDKVQWEEMRLPAYSEVIGRYPQAENEIMFPLWVLERLNINPEIGTEVRLSYTVEEDGGYVQYDEVFTLTGWIVSHMHIRSGNIDSLFVSEALSRKYGKTFMTDGAVSIIFKDSAKANEYCNMIERDLEISDTKRVRVVPMYASGTLENTSVFAALMIIALFLALTGYLLIYNVLYISVSNDVRFYGLLKTLGTTPRQISQIVIGQILRLCVLGIPIGLAIAALLSLVIVPSIIEYGVTVSTGAVVSFSPVIYIGAAVFALLTAFLGAIRPAKKAAIVSPIEAQKYTGDEPVKSSVRYSAKGNPCKMALRNIFRYKKRAVVVLFSLFLGITTFTTISAVVSGMDTDNFVDSYLENDFKLTNNTIIFIGGDNAPKQKFNDSFLESIKAIEGFEKLQYDTKDMFYITYTEEFDAFTENKPHYAELTPEELDSIKKNFTSIAIGVDPEALAVINESDGMGLDIDAFERGEYILISHIDNSFLGEIESVEIRSWPEREIISSVPVGGTAPRFFHNSMFSSAPTMIMSNSLMERLTGGAVRSMLYIDVKDGYDKQFFEELKSLTENDYEISRESKIEARESMRNTKIMMSVLGGGVAVILGFIGVLNFVNVMSVGIVVRKRELAIMESIGMSRRQMRLMLLCEGVGYAIITLLLVLSLGSAVTYGVFKLFQQQADYAVFAYPILPMITAALAILAVCIVTPEAAYRAVNKSTIVERLRAGD